MKLPVKIRHQIYAATTVANYLLPENDAAWSTQLVFTRHPRKDGEERKGGMNLLSIDEYQDTFAMLKAIYRLEDRITALCKDCTDTTNEPSAHPGIKEDIELWLWDGICIVIRSDFGTQTSGFQWADSYISTCIP